MRAHPGTVPVAAAPAAMKILHDPLTLSHSTLELLGSKVFPAYESPERVKTILAALGGAHRPITTTTLDLAAAEAAALTVHTPEYLDHLKTVFSLWLSQGLVEEQGCVLPECFPLTRLATSSRGPSGGTPGGSDKGSRRKKLGPPKDICARVGYYAFDMSCGIAAHTYTSAIASVDLARRGAVALLDAPEIPVFALTRPPGHHCSADLSGGYCYLNNTAVAVTTLVQARPTERVTILDVDFHHGNGTQDLFYKTSNPAYVSIHGEDEYPYYSGAADEIGEGEGEGYTLNIPLDTAASTVKEYVVAMEQAVRKIREVDTRWLVVSLGFDTFRLDPLGKFELDTEDYRVIARLIGELGLPTLLILEGGYCIEKLGEMAIQFLMGLEEGLRSARGKRRT